MSLEKLRSALLTLPETSTPYYVPTLWDAEPLGNRRSIDLFAQPKSYYLKQLDWILAQPKSEPTSAGAKGGEWSKDATIYNLFVRTTTAYDHDGNGNIDSNTTLEGFRETGTFLKSIALLPHIKRLGANTVHLLPITSIGKDGNKGSLGSPYAIKNPYTLDDRLCEPALGLGVETEFKAFVDACHHLGLRVVVEFVFRTAAKDADWVQSHPDWFYWIDERVENRPQGATDEARYGNPIFTAQELAVISEKVKRDEFTNLPPPHEMYRSMFTPTPTKVELHDGRYLGLTDARRVCRIPGAFADWPPQDTQPPWGDVTYLKLYTHPNYNYIAYNTIRMYAAELAQPEFINAPLWESIIGIIPHYQTAFGIDGVMIDMGHALPTELKSRMVAAARQHNPDFAFWDENFATSVQSRAEGYNAVIGSLPFVMHHLNELKNFLKGLAVGGTPIPFFGTAESHNTPRTAARFGGSERAEAGRNFSKFVWSLVSVLPVMPFIHSGFELGETYPINTGLGFTPDELPYFPPEKLPLFSEYAYRWTTESDGESMVEHIEHLCRVSQARRKYHRLITNADTASLTVIELPNPNIVALVRRGEGTELLFLGNYNPVGAERVSVPMKVDPGTEKALNDAFTGRRYNTSNGNLDLTLSAGECLLLEI